MLGLGGKTTQESVLNLVHAIQELMKKVGIPMNIQDCGVGEQEFLLKLDTLADHAHSDQCTMANPRYPLVAEIKEIYRKAYYGEEIK